MAKERNAFIRGAECNNEIHALAPELFRKPAYNSPLFIARLNCKGCLLRNPRRVEGLLTITLNFPLRQGIAQGIDMAGNVYGAREA